VKDGDVGASGSVTTQSICDVLGDRGMPVRELTQCEENLVEVAVIQSIELQKERLGLTHSTGPIGLLNLVPLLQGSGQFNQLDKDQAGSSLGGDEVGLT
jgi:hypothetical protein